MKTLFQPAAPARAAIWSALSVLALTIIIQDATAARRCHRVRRVCRIRLFSRPCCVSPINVTQKTPDWQPLFDGKSLSGWKVADKFEFDGSEPAEVVDGTIQLPIGGPQAGIRYAGEEPLPRMNYEIALEARRTNGVDFFCGMTFPVDENYCTLIVGGWGGTTVGLSNVNGQAAANNETTLERQFEHHRWYRVRLRVSEHRISVWFDDEQAIDLAKKGKEFDIWWEQEPMRPLGISSWFTASQLRDIKVRELSPVEIAADAAAVAKKAEK